MSSRTVWIWNHHRGHKSTQGQGKMGEVKLERQRVCVDTNEYAGEPKQ